MGWPDRKKVDKPVVSVVASRSVTSVSQSQIQDRRIGRGTCRTTCTMPTGQAEVDYRIRVATQNVYQAPIDAEAT